ncbi:MAG TPA: hypothetical protein VHZ29_15920 [Rhizomicrobium sp.]|nr:hypothetical protein [Rhizomicrobium sp.]
MSRRGGSRARRGRSTEEVYPGVGSRVDLALAALLILLCAGLLCYLYHALSASA